MLQDTPKQCVLFQEVAARPVEVEFSDTPGSSDGGALLLPAAETRVGIIRHLASCIPDLRDPMRIIHTYEEMMRQRVFGIACGWDDANDADRLRGDWVHRTMVAGNPQDPLALSSQPTLCRLENVVDSETLRTMERAMIVHEILRHSKRLRGGVRQVIIEGDWTDGATHGEQEGATYNGYYGHTCYRVMQVHVRFGDEPERHLIAARLMAGTGTAVPDTRDLLFWTLAAITAYLPKARRIVCLDGGFQHDDLLADLEREHVGYTIGIAGNDRLERLARPVMKQAKLRADHGTRGALAFGDVRYKANSWSRERRVIVKAEADPDENTLALVHTRYVVTNLPQSPRWLYREVYARRGDQENRIKEIKLDLALGRTSCQTFIANQFRVLLSAAAYILMQEIRRAARGTSLARAQVRRLRETLLKIGARVVVSVRHLRILLPRSTPFQNEWLIVARRLGAAFG
jgi:hypothetical protein